MLRYASGRLLQTIPTLFVLSLLVFTLLRLAPGDPAELRMGREAARPENRAKLEALRHEMGLDLPIPVQYVNWLRNVAVGDLGTSIKTSQPAAALVLSKAPATLELLVGAMAFALLVSVPTGIAAATRRGSVLDRVAMTFVGAGLAVPSLWLGLTLILLLSVGLHWLPPNGYVPFQQAPLNNLLLLLMPAVTLGVYLAATLIRFLRADLIEMLGADFVRTARAKGLHERQVILGHALRNALISVLTVAGLEMGALLGGAVIIEQVFGWSGIGWLTVQAIFDRDYAVVQASVLFIAVGLMGVNLLVDLGYGYLNPRVRSRMSG